MRAKNIAAIALGIVLSGGSLAAAELKKSTPEAEAARADIQKTFGFVPQFLKHVPDSVIPGAWEEMKSLQLSPTTALSGKYKELIGLAVAAQIPCEYCVQAHTEFAKLNGATEEELGEAIFMGAMTRHWSTFINGLQPDEVAFRGAIDRLVEHVKKSSSSGSAQSSQTPAPDPETAKREIAQAFGEVPEFLSAFPPEGLPGAWTVMRDFEMSPTTVLPPKYKDLISLAVSAQMPCRYCVIADTQFARMDGASEREIREAIAIASIVRQWSTFLNGNQEDKTVFRKDVNRIVKEMKRRTEASKTAAR